VPDIVAGLIGVGFMVLWIYCLYDVVTTDESDVRNLPKLVWLLIVFLLFDIGSLLWLAFGRPAHWTRTVAAQRKAGIVPVSGTPPTLDDPSLDRLNPIVRHREEQARLRMWEAQLGRREEELRRRELDVDPDGGTTELPPAD
jgi:hypothetical protein